MMNEFKIKVANRLGRLFFCVFSLLLCACSNDNRDLKQYVKEVKALAPMPIEAAPQFMFTPKFLFPINANRHNPFNQYEQHKDVEQYVPDQHRTKQALEAFPLAALKFVGSLKQANSTWGLIRQPDSKINVVKVGDYMGKNYGRIIAVKNDFLKLEETIKIQGKWEKHVIALNLYAGK